MITRQFATSTLTARVCLACTIVPAMTLRLFLAWLLILVVLHAKVVTAAINADYPKKIHFRNIMQNQDIALGEVEAILQDHQGFMWLGGRNALLRYDGNEFLPIPAAKDANNLNETEAITQVLEFMEDRNRTLWVATRSGLYRYNRDYEVLVPETMADRIISEGTFYALAETANGVLLFGTANGLVIYDEASGSMESLSVPQGNLPSNLVADIDISPDGTVWLGLDVGVAELDLTTHNLKLHIPSAANPTSTLENSIRTLAIDDNGRVWAGGDNGIYRLDPTTGQFTHYLHDPNDPSSIGNNFSRQIHVDRHGWVWTGSDGAGVGLYDEKNNTWINFERGDSAGRLGSNTIRRIYEDRIGDLWFGTYPSGVYVYDRSSAATRMYKKSGVADQGPMDNNVEALVEDNQGNLWIGAGGISRFDLKSNQFIHYKPGNGPDARVATTAIVNGARDSQGNLFFGTWGAAVQRYNPVTDRFDTIPVDPDISKRGEQTGTKLNDLMVWNIYEDKNRHLWFSTHSNGITRFDPATGTYYYYGHNQNDSSTISSPVVWVSREDSQGRFWVGTAYGLNLMDRTTDRFKQYVPDSTKPRSLANGSVLSIHEDRKGRLWFGTDLGLHLYVPETDDFTLYDRSHGFVDHGIRAIIEDRYGSLWLGTNNGIVRFNPDTMAVQNYTRLNSELIGGIATGAALALSDGTMAFGSRNGLILFDVDELDDHQNETPPNIAITDFRLFTEKVEVDGPDQLLTRSITQTDAITLDYTQSMISFRFAALNYREPEKNNYAYKLEGFDNQWREVGNQRAALYTNLPAGSYIFRVKASNNDGIWNEQGQSLKVTVLPPPWKTWWAYAIYMAAALAAVLLFVRNQQRKVTVARNISRELENKVAERTAELQNKNAELEEAYAQLEAISLSDPLTGLSNRRYLQKLMPMDTAKVQREYDAKFSGRPQKKPTPDLSFFILDVDHFKSVNDIHGHTAGDQLLIQLSELLTHACRESDCVVRWGGEEFLIVSRFSDREDAPLLAERIRQSIANHAFTLPDGSALKKTCSIGFACFPFLREAPAALTWEQVIDVADLALYAAKKSGRNRSVGVTASATTDPVGLHQQISRNLKAMVDNNEVTVVAQNANELIWD